MREQAIELLKCQDLRITEARVCVLSFIIESNIAYSFVEMEEYFKDKCDRSATFRTLKELTRIQILEEFVNTKGIRNYILKSQNEILEGSHYHYKCISCEKAKPMPVLPEAYLENLGKNTIASLNLIIEGTCEQCQSTGTVNTIIFFLSLLSYQNLSILNV